MAKAWFENDHVSAILDVAASATALAAVNVGKQDNKIVILNSPGSSGLTNEACTPSSVHYTFDTYAMAHVIGGATVKNGGDSWFFLTADYAFGYALENDTAAVVKQAGGKVLGDVKAPLNTADFSSFLLQAQSSKAKVIGLANAGGDFINSVKQASRVRHHPERAESRRPPRLHQRHQQPWPASDAGHAALCGLLLGHERRDARLGEALQRAYAPHAQHVAGRQLLLDDALSPGRAGGRHRSRPARS